MKPVIYIGLIVLFISFIGCTNKPNSVSASKKNTDSAVNKAASQDSSSTKSEGKDDPFAEILDKDVFTPPDMRAVMRTSPSSSQQIEEKIEPQKITITGIVYDGEQYLVSIENSETGESSYLKAKDKLAQYPIVAIDFDKVEVKHSKKNNTYRVGDQIPLPGTRSASRVDNLLAEDTTLGTSTTGTGENETTTALAPAKDSIEEMLRQRRLKQEEALK